LFGLGFSGKISSSLSEVSLGFLVSFLVVDLSVLLGVSSSSSLSTLVCFFLEVVLVLDFLVSIAASSSSSSS